MIKLLNFKTIIEQDEDGYFVASVPAVPGCHSQGKTYEEAIENVTEALELSLEVARENPSYSGKISFPNERLRDKFIGVVDLPVRFAL